MAVVLKLLWKVISQLLSLRNKMSVCSGVCHVAVTRASVTQREESFHLRGDAAVWRSCGPLASVPVRDVELVMRRESLASCLLFQKVWLNYFGNLLPESERVSSVAS